MGLSTSAKVSLASNAVALSAIGLAWHGLLPAMPLAYTTHKLLHLVGIVLFGGNLVAGPLWFALAWFDDDPKVMAFAARALAACDIALTTPGVQLAIWNGLWMAGALGGIEKVPWLTEAAALMTLTSLVSSTLVLYFQERLIEAAVAGDRARINWALAGWSVFGTAIGLPLGWVFWLMVTKRAALFGG